MQRWLPKIEYALSKFYVNVILYFVLKEENYSINTELKFTIQNILSKYSQV